MLQMEHEKATKKISETSKKTDELIRLRQVNDLKFQKEAEEQEARKKAALDGAGSNYAVEQQRRQQIQAAKFNMYNNKKKLVQDVQNNTMKELQRKEVEM